MTRRSAPARALLPTPELRSKIVGADPTERRALEEGLDRVADLAYKLDRCLDTIVVVLARDELGIEPWEPVARTDVIRWLDRLRLDAGEARRRVDWMRDAA